MNGYEFRNVTGEAADLFVYEEIGEDIFGEGITLLGFKDELKDLGAVKQINLHIASIGGNVFDARAMASLLKQNKAKKIGYIDSVCASAATYLLTSCQKIFIANDGLVMIHRPKGGAWGTSQDMRELADILDTVQVGMITAYKELTGLDENKLTELINAETWMTPPEAIENGFAHEVIEAKRIAAKVDLSKFPNNKLPFEIPEQFKERIELEVPTPILDSVKEQIKIRRQKLQMAGYRKELAEVGDE